MATQETRAVKQYYLLINGSLGLNSHAVAHRSSGLISRHVTCNEIHGDLTHDEF